MLINVSASMLIYITCTKTRLSLENVAIANALRLEAARATPVLSRLNKDN